MDNPEILDFLLGSWRAERVIEDHRIGRRGTFVGTSTFTEFERPDKSPLERKASFDETGELRFGTYQGTSHRALEYVQIARTLVQIFFTDGQPFICLDLSSGTWQGTHHCVHDYYEITFAIKSNDVLQERWRIQGPNKDYSAEATLTRIGILTPPPIANWSRVDKNAKAGI
jgi:hypothetical protein